ADRSVDLIRPGHVQVLRVGVTLTSIAEDGDLLVLDEVDVAVAIIIDAHGLVLSWLLAASIGSPTQMPVQSLTILARYANYHSWIDTMTDGSCRSTTPTAASCASFWPIPALQSEE